MHWISSYTKPLKPWIRNRVIEISRFSNANEWYHVESSMNPADKGTRKGASLSDVDAKSSWINGLPWMHQPLDELYGFKLNNIQDIKLKQEHLLEIKREQTEPPSDLCRSDYHVLLNAVVEKASVCSSLNHLNATIKPDLISERLRFSHYLVNPNKFRFAKVVRIIAIVVKFSKLLL